MNKKKVAFVCLLLISFDNYSYIKSDNKLIEIIALGLIIVGAHTIVNKLFYSQIHYTKKAPDSVFNELNDQVKKITIEYNTNKTITQSFVFLEGPQQDVDAQANLSLQYLHKNNVPHISLSILSILDLLNTISAYKPHLAIKRIVILLRLYQDNSDKLNISLSTEQELMKKIQNRSEECVTKYISDQESFKTLQKLLASYYTYPNFEAALSERTFNVFTSGHYDDVIVKTSQQDNKMQPKILSETVKSDTKSAKQNESRYDAITLLHDYVLTHTGLNKVKIISPSYLNECFENEPQNPLKTFQGIILIDNKEKTKLSASTITNELHFYIGHEHEDDYR